MTLYASGIARIHGFVLRAVRYGILKRPKRCSRCKASRKSSDGRSLIYGHHDDYSKPLDVMWLCPVCHAERHRELGWGISGQPDPTYEERCRIISATPCPPEILAVENAKFFNPYANVPSVGPLPTAQLSTIAK